MSLIKLDLNLYGNNLGLDLEGFDGHVSSGVLDFKCLFPYRMSKFVCFTRYMPKLLRLEINDVKTVNGAALIALLSTCPALTHLVVSGDYNFTDENGTVIIETPSKDYRSALKELDLSGCLLSELINVAHYMPKLVCLNFGNLHFVNAGKLTTLLSTFAEMADITISQCSSIKLVKGERSQQKLKLYGYAFSELLSAAPYIPKLTHLDVSCDHAVHASHILTLLSCCLELQELTIKSRGGTSSTVSMPLVVPSALATVSRLQKLELQSCIDSEGLVAMISRCPRLTSIRLRCNLQRGIVDDVVLQALSANCPQLQCVTVTGIQWYFSRADDEKMFVLLPSVSSFEIAKALSRSTFCTYCQ